jgi:hypothetical protein
VPARESPALGLGVHRGLGPLPEVQQRAVETAGLR